MKMDDILSNIPTNIPTDNILDDLERLEILDKYVSEKLMDKIIKSFNSQLDESKNIFNINLMSGESIIKKYNLKPTENKNEYYGEEGIFREYNSLIGIGAKITMKVIEETYHKMHPDDRKNITKLYNKYSMFLEYSRSEKMKIYGTIFFRDNDLIDINVRFKNC